MSISVMVCYVIQGDEEDPETGVQSSFRVERPVPPRALTLFRLKEMFPFVGTFHFRLKIADDSGRSDFCWVDLIRDSEDVLELAKNLGGVERTNGGEPRVYLKVLPIDFGVPLEKGVVGESSTEAFSPEGPGVYQIPLNTDTRAGDDLAGGVASMDLGGGSVHTKVNVNISVDEARGVERRPSPCTEDKRVFDHPLGMRYDSEDHDDGVVNGDDEGRGGDEGGRRRTTEDGDYDVYSDEQGANWKSSVETRFQSGINDLQKKSAQVAKTVGSGAKKWFQIINKGVGGAQLPSEEAMENLYGLSRMLATPFSNQNQEHVKDMRKIWECLFPDDEFEGVESDRWKDAGFRQANVAVDFRGTGVLAAKGIFFFCLNYGWKARTLCQAQVGSSASRYPWAVVANNVTLMLVQVFYLRGDRFASSRTSHWEVFERRDAYFQIFCMAFTLFDHTWTSRRAKRDQFEQVIEHTKEVVEQVLGSGPPDLDAFMREAEEMGMLRL